MIDSDQRQGSNRYPLNKLASKSQSDLRVFSNRHPFQILRFMADLLVWVKAYISEGHSQDIVLRK